ncbi:uncharacterized mitochondrial protein AtMg00810-like [Spinacia oleracea]|uniref:Uncharacterized mitochondrial protein AtMg00810-like n=1 Tax=Spinacia oleracea TaxID=3562 RepID=A0ABM3RP32_SPIOL|nr:uncharacterized mitochondrial protein AtMg00810-like [Spinacia oleracea]
MQDEYGALIKTRTWDLVPKPTGVNVVNFMWIFSHKENDKGDLLRHKARLVCDGRSQKKGVDCDETFSPVVKPATIRTVLGLAMARKWSIHHLDLKNAFLHGDLQDTVYMHQPLGFVDRRAPNYLCLFRKALYGLKHAHRGWYQRFAKFLLQMGFTIAKSDTSLFNFRNGDDMAYLLLYVDDIILCTSSNPFLDRLISHLQTEFPMSDLGPLNYFLGISVTRTPSYMLLSQQKYAQEILERAGMGTCKPAATPVNTNAKLSADSGPSVQDPTHYRSLAGALQYLTFTRPNIAYAVQQVCLFMHDPREPHFNALKRILHYIQGTIDHGLHLYPTSTLHLITYTDADWGGCPDTRRSTSGYCCFLGDNLISWSSKR